MGAQPAFATDLEIDTVETDEAPSFEAIRLRSQEIWEREGRPEGRAEDHWNRARAELAALMARTSNTHPCPDIAEPVAAEPEPAVISPETESIDPAKSKEELDEPEGQAAAQPEPSSGLDEPVAGTPDQSTPVAVEQPGPAKLEERTPAASVEPVPVQPRPLRLPPKRSNAPTGAPSIISHGIELCGTLQSPGEIQFNGFIDGTLCGASLIVDEDGAVEGEVYAEHVTVRGRVKGRIFAHKVLLCAGCSVEGDVLYGALTIEMGAQLDAAFQRWEPAPES